MVLAPVFFADENMLGFGKLMVRSGRDDFLYGAEARTWPVGHRSREERSAADGTALALDCRLVSDVG